MMEATISVYHDLRREKKDKNNPAESDKGKKDHKIYPVKIRVYYNKVTRYYPTGIDLTEDEFERSYLAQKPRADLKDIKTKIISLQHKAETILEDLKEFSFDRFEKRFLRHKGAENDLNYHYEQRIKEFMKEDRVKTATCYEFSLRSLKLYFKSRGKRTERLTFEDITVEALRGYEKWMLGEGNSTATLGFYLRPLKALFNHAIEEGEIPRELYPFGKKKYQIPASQNVKRALNKAEIKKIFECDLSLRPSMDRARDYWMFSYLCNGMNIRDIAELKYKNITGDTITFIRRKTKNTTRTNQKTIVAVLTAPAKAIIEKRGNPKINGETLVFPILNSRMSEAEKVNTLKSFISRMNENLKRVAKLVGIEHNITSYWARHSFSTVAIQSGASLEFVMESLGHHDMATTQNYFKGFDDSVKKDIANKLMDFD